jgi:hypothetical protein
MTENNPLGDKEDRAPYTTLGGSAQAARDLSDDLHMYMQPPQEPKSNQTVENQENRYHEIKQPRHDQDQNACNDGQDRGDMGDGEGHGERLR